MTLEEVYKKIEDIKLYREMIYRYYGYYEVDLYYNELWC